MPDDSDSPFKDRHPSRARLRSDRTTTDENRIDVTTEPTRARPTVAAVASSLPAAVAQADVEAFTRTMHPEIDPERVRQVFANSGIERRHLVEPIDWYADPKPLGERSARSAELASRHGLAAASAALDAAGVEPADVHTVVFVSTTVVRSPSLDVALVSGLGLRPDTRRVPLFGMASLGGAAGLGLAADLTAPGGGCVLVVCAEMNSLTFMPAQARGMESVVSMALFSDGAAAALLCPGEHPAAGPDRPRIVARHSTLVPDSVAVMGFDVTDVGLRWHLSPDVPAVAAEWTGKSVADAVGRVGWSTDSLDHVLLHPGGSRVLDAVEQALALDPGTLRQSREVMREHGNISGATVLLVLEQFLRTGAFGRTLLTAMGPGFGFEHILLDFPEPDTAA